MPYRITVSRDNLYAAIQAIEDFALTLMSNGGVRTV